MAHIISTAKHFPWKRIGRDFLMLTIIVAVIALSISVVIGARSDSARETPSQIEQVNTAPVVNPPAQIKPEVVAPVAPVVVDYRGNWVGVQGFDPSTIPVEEGFYSGISLYSLYPGTDEGDLGPVPVRYAYAWGILPQLEGLPVAVAAARDENNKDIVLVALDAHRYGPYILLSVNGGKSLCKLDLLPRDRGRYAVATRIVARGEEIHLYGQDPRPGNHWWEQMAIKSELPCS